MPKPLVIVESPAKARTIATFLGKDFLVESSIGHIRDLPSSAGEIPEAYRSESWARLGVDVDNGFKPLYVVSKDKKAQVTRLKKLLTEASELYLATDEDREGESIAWHLMEVLAPRVPVKRMVFHEITRQAIERAVNQTRDLDRRLVDAQEARRILDRLYGYEVSPVLWRKVMPRLSAGRVQSVATRILVERERARMRFRAANWWDLTATLDHSGQRFEATLTGLDGSRLATGRDFDELGALKAASAGSQLVVLDEQRASDLAERLEGVPAKVESVEEKPFRRSPHPPFMTSTLQQEAGRKLRFTAQRAMSVAQRLYEGGYITYMRTDSIELSDTAIKAARELAKSLYGADYVPPAPRHYKSKVRNAQEAHEAIRPAGDSFRSPEAVARELGSDEARLYELIWRRTVASQMTDATGMSATVRISATPRPADSGVAEAAELVARGRVIRFAGFLKAYVAGQDETDSESEDSEKHLPNLTAGQMLELLEAVAAGHATQPPPRYTEASLVAALEDLGVGRPSTYASIIGTIQERKYVWKKGTQLVPSFVAFAVVGLMEQHFPDLVDFGFTAAMEDQLDDIAGGRQETIPYLDSFYFGGDRPGLKDAVSDQLPEIDAREINSISIGTDDVGRAVVVRVGRYGPYLQRGEDRAPVPEDLEPDQLTLERAAQLLEAPSSDRVVGVDPASGLNVLVRSGRFGPYVQLGDVEPGSKDKPKRASLLSSMHPDNLSLEESLALLSLPRTLGVDPENGEEVLAANGPYGPYVKRGRQSRSLASEDQIFTVDLSQALELLAQPRQARGRRVQSDLAELGTDPNSAKPIVLKQGRFGPYVSDGDTNASLRRGDDPDRLTLDRAIELLAERRAAGPAQPRTRSRAATTETRAPRSRGTKTAASGTTRAPRTTRRRSGK